MIALLEFPSLIRSCPSAPPEKARFCSATRRGGKEDPRLGPGGERAEPEGQLVICASRLRGLWEVWDKEEEVVKVNYSV